MRENRYLQGFGAREIAGDLRKGAKGCRYATLCDGWRVRINALNHECRENGYA
jgi:hypothetical protein